MSRWPGEVVMGQGWFSYYGPIGDGDKHRHSAIQICIATDNEIHVGTDDAHAHSGEVLVIGSNVTHRLQRSTNLATLVYVERSSIPGLWIQRAMNLECIHVPDGGAVRRIQSTLRSKTSHSSTLVRRIVAAIWPTFDFAGGLDPMDTRVRQTLNRIEKDTARSSGPRELAALAGLSTSRLRHLFTEQVGISLSSYLLWQKVLHAARSLGDQDSLTTAAHAGGFADSAHMARTFRRMFGVSPSNLTAQGSIRLDTSSDSFLVQNQLQE